IEAGTGLRQTNLLRAILSSRVGGAVVGLGFDRIDTNGSPELGSFARNFVWLNLAYQLPGQVWGQLEWRNTTSDRESLPTPKRRDWILRLRRTFGDAWYADIIAGSGRQEIDTLASGVADDSLRKPIVGEAHQLAVRAARSAERWRTQLTVRAWDGDDVPQLETEGSLEVEVGPASLYGSGQFAKWEAFTLAAGYGALRLRLPLGVRLFAELEEGDRGLFGARPVAWHEFSRRTAGLELQLWSWTLMGRAGSWKVLPSPALGVPFDSASGLAGGTVDVAEASARGPLAKLFGGQLSVGGWYRWHEVGPFYYWPQTWWRLEGLYHVLALSDQLEIWLSVLGGVRGSTSVPDLTGGAELGVASGNLNWLRGEAVVRIRDIHIFYNYEYFDLVTGEAGVRDFVLPQVRTHFGVKWEFWN
ncbi:MAG: hypothetical protein JSU87_15600, partial [Gemmatimonadota bacterium]